jgi:cation transport ATPase
VPVYLTNGEMTADIEQLMRVASLILTLPVMFYAAAPFFRGACRDVRHWQLGMDVPVALGIGAAFAASVAATATGSGQVYFDSVTMFVFLLLAARYLEMTARARAAMIQEQLAQQAPAVAERFAAWPGSDLAEMVAAGRLHVGDHLRIRLGIAAVLGGATPHDKLDYVQRLQRDGTIVAMVGDGVNDAAGLATAQVSIAMGGGADIACSNSDVILLSGRLDALLTAVRTAHATLRVIHQNVAWAFIYNLVAIPHPDG